MFALIAGAIFGVLWVLHASSITVRDWWAERRGERKVTARRQETVEAAPTPRFRDDISARFRQLEVELRQMQLDNPFLRTKDHHLYPLVESASKGAATNKPEMEGYLAAMQRNFADENYPPEWQLGVLKARDLLDKAPDLQTFLQQYQRIAMRDLNPPAEAG